MQESPEVLCRIALVVESRSQGPEARLGAASRGSSSDSARPRLAGVVSGWRGTSGRCYELWEERSVRAGDAADSATAASASAGSLWPTMRTMSPSRTSSTPEVRISVGMWVRSRYAAHSSDDRELVAAVAEGLDLIVGEVLPFGEEAPQPGTYSGVAIPDLALDPRLGGGPLDIGVEQREKIIEPVGTVGVEVVPAQLSVGDALVLRRGHAECDRTPLPPRGTAKPRPLMPANRSRACPSAVSRDRKYRLASIGVHRCLPCKAGASPLHSRLSSAATVSSRWTETLAAAQTARLHRWGIERLLVILLAALERPKEPSPARLWR